MIHQIPHEIEVKFYPVDIEQMRKKLASVGAVCVHPMRLMRRVVFDDEQNPHLPVTYIRVRDEGNCVRISTKEYADEAKGIKFQRELDILVNDFDKAIALLEIAGLKRSFYQESKREQWKLENSEICIDIWPHLKPHIEIESPDEDELKKVAHMMNMVWETHTNGGTLKLYVKEYGCTRDEAYKLTSHLLFNKPLHKIE